MPIFLKTHISIRFPPPGVETIGRARGYADAMRGIKPQCYGTVYRLDPWDWSVEQRHHSSAPNWVFDPLLRAIKIEEFKRVERATHESSHHHCV